MLREPVLALGSLQLGVITIIVFTFKGQLSGRLQGELIAFSSLSQCPPWGTSNSTHPEYFNWEEIIFDIPKKTPDTTSIRSCLAT